MPNSRPNFDPLGGQDPGLGPKGSQNGSKMVTLDPLGGPGGVNFDPWGSDFNPGPNFDPAGAKFNPMAKILTPKRQKFGPCGYHIFLILLLLLQLFFLNSEE